MPTLKVGTKYDVDSITFVGWTVGDGSGTEGYNARDYFTPDGTYLGPDDSGIEPLVSEARRPAQGK